MANLEYDSTYSIALAILNKIKGEEQPIPPEPEPVYPEDNQVFFMTLDGAQVENIPEQWGDATVTDIQFDATNEFWVITFDKSLTTMPEAALTRNDYLNFVFLPSSLTTIQGIQFVGTPMLEEIWFNGVKADWEAITKREDWLDATSGVDSIVCRDEIIPV